MSTISKKELEDYKKMCYDRNCGRSLAPNGLQFICEVCKNDPKTIGKHMLETMVRIQSKE